MIISVYNEGTGYITTDEDYRSILGQGPFSHQIEIEEWEKDGIPAAGFADSLLLVAITALGSGMLGGALSEAGKDVYTAFKHGVGRLLHLKMKKTYRTTARVALIRPVDDVAVPITLHLFQAVDGENAPTEGEIEERLGEQLRVLDREWPKIAAQVRELRATGEDLVEVAVLTNKRVLIERGWSIPGWQPSPQAPALVERVTEQSWSGERWQRVQVQRPTSSEG